MAVGELLREARCISGMTQADLAEAAGTSQSRLSTYESGKVTPSRATLTRLLAAVQPRPSTLLRRHRADVLRLADACGFEDVRVFGSVARGTDTTESDIDLLVSAREGTSLLELARLVAELEALLGVSVDVVTRGGLDPQGDPILAEAVPLLADTAAEERAEYRSKRQRRMETTAQELRRLFDDATQIVEAGRERLDTDMLTRRAARNIIGELAFTLDRLPSEVLETSGVPMASVRGMRNLITHVDQRIDHEIVWQAFATHLPQLREALSEFL